MSRAEASGGARSATAAPPRVGFLGVGWIGRNRMEAVAADGLVEVAALADPAPECLEAAAESAPAADHCGSLDELLERDLDAVVIATPSALHAEQAEAALAAGLSVFCQKPLGRTAFETRRVVEAARAADRLLAVDMSYRHTAAVQELKRLVDAGELGDVFAMDLVFHNAYGPDKPWFRDFELAGGGCMMDLGIHLVDLALWLLDAPEVVDVAARLTAGGRALPRPPEQVEDHAVATLELADGVVVRIACSWYLPAGRDAVIGVELYGTGGGAALRNVGGSFYDFTAERYRGTTTETLAGPPDAWGGRAIRAWARRLAEDPGYDPAVEELTLVARTLDRVYGR